MSISGDHHHDNEMIHTCFESIIRTLSHIGAFMRTTNQKIKRQDTEIEELIKRIEKLEGKNR